MRKFAFAAFSLVVCVGLNQLSAEEFGGMLSKVDGSKVTITKKGAKKGEKGEEVTLTAVEKVKVVKGTFNKETKKLEAGDAIEDGLKNEMFAKGGVFVSVTTNDDGKITQIIVAAKKKKKDNN